MIVNVINTSKTAISIAQQIHKYRPYKSWFYVRWKELRMQVYRKVYSLVCSTVYLSETAKPSERWLGVTLDRLQQFHVSQKIDTFQTGSDACLHSTQRITSHAPIFMVTILLCSYNTFFAKEKKSLLIALFPGPLQLSVTCSIEKRERA